RGVMRRHPADPYFPRVGALAAWRSGKESPIPWIQRALDRGPRIGSTHLAIAYILASVGAKNQTLFELELATEYQPGLIRRVAPLVNRIAQSYEDVARAVPDGAVGTRLLAAVALGRKSEAAGDLRERLLGEALARDPDLIGVRSAIAHDLVQALGG